MWRVQCSHPASPDACHCERFVAGHYPKTVGHAEIRTGGAPLILSSRGERIMKHSFEFLMRHCVLSLLASLVVAAGISASTAVAQVPSNGTAELDRTVLPIPEPQRPTYQELDARKAKPPARFEVKAPEGAPNVVIVLIDD